MPLPTAKQVTCPVLILHGDKDAHVPVEHAHYLAQTLRSKGNPDVTVRIFKEINHVFLPDKGGRKSGYLKLLRKGAKVPEPVLDSITEPYSELQDNKTTFLPGRRGNRRRFDLGKSVRQETT